MRTGTEMYPSIVMLASSLWLAADHGIHHGRSSDMEEKMDVGTMVTAFGNVAYVAIAIGCAASNLGFSLQVIREVAVISALLVATPTAIDFFRRKPNGAK